MLTILDFNALDDEAKSQAVWAGEYLADRVMWGKCFQLYSLVSFYVEVEYDPVKNKILSFDSFTGISKLVPYLKAMGPFKSIN